MSFWGDVGTVFSGGLSQGTSQNAGGLATGGFGTAFPIFQNGGNNSAGGNGPASPFGPPAQPPGPAPATAASPTPLTNNTGNNYTPGSYAPIAPPAGGGTPFGNISNQQLGSPQWGTGASFIGAGESAAIPAIEEGMSTQNPADAQSMNMLRDYYNKQLYNVPGNGDIQNSAYGKSAQGGLNNLLSLNQRAAGGNPGAGDSAYGGIQGTVGAKLGQTYSQGLQGAKQAGVQQASSIAGGLGNVNNSNMNQRQFDMTQGNALTQAILQQQQVASGQAAQLQQQNQFSNTMQDATTMDAIMPFGAAAGYMANHSSNTPTDSTTFNNGNGDNSDDPNFGKGSGAPDFSNGYSSGGRVRGNLVGKWRG